MVVYLRRREMFSRGGLTTDNEFFVIMRGLTSVFAQIAKQVDGQIVGIFASRELEEVGGFDPEAGKGLVDILCCWCRSR